MVCLYQLGYGYACAPFLRFVQSVHIAHNVRSSVWSIVGVDGSVCPSGSGRGGGAVGLYAAGIAREDGVWTKQQQESNE